jgi:Ca-activated chloride channel homolog
LNRDDPSSRCRRTGLSHAFPLVTLMRLWPIIAVLASLLALQLQAQAPEDPEAAQAWRAALAKAARENKLVLAFDRPGRCTSACASFEQRVLKHPAMECRLEEVVLVTRPIAGLQMAGLALYDHRGTLIRRIETPRDLAAFASLLERIVSPARQAAAVVASPTSVIRVMPPEEQIVSGRTTVRTTVSSTKVARVVFSVDGQERAAVNRPPFSAPIDFGRIPQVSTIRAVAYDVNRKEIGRDELTVNHGGEMFWIRLLEPREGKASGTVRVTATLRAPAGHDVKRVVVAWNDAERAVIAAEPWQADLDIPNQAGVLQVKAELGDGRTAEDAVLLNATGHVERADVPLVEIPVTITASDGSPARVAPADVVVREGRTRRTVESVTGGSEAPLTVGVVFDTSDSMCRSLRGVQDAAIRFLDTTLGANDRAFVIAFDNDARLVQTPTSDRTLLRRQILGLRAKGSTALYDALIVAMLQFEGVKGRRALIVFSDGDDRTSRFRARDIAELARRSNIPVYLIAAPAVARPNRGMAASRRYDDPFETRAAGESETWAQVFAYLAGVIRSTGGLVHHLKNLAELPAVYQKIEAALRAQSLVVIRTAPGRGENDWRAIDVEVGGAKRDVRAPAGYYAPW